MEYRTLGRSGLKVSAFSFGTMTFGGTGMFAGIGQTVGSDADRQIGICLDAGVNLFDTADMYSNGASEEVLGAVLGARRSQALVATKAFGAMGEGVNDLGASRHHLIRACEASLRRLKTDYIDLYQIHNQDLATPADETLRALDDLVRQGKVRYIGSSNHAGWTKMKALATSERLGLERYVSQQIQYSLIRREAEHELLPLGIAEGVGAIVWGPLASGYLSGKYQGQRGPQATRLSDALLASYDDDRGRAIIVVLEEIAGSRAGASIGQVALNWIARKAGVATILVGARTDEQLRDNLAAAGWSLTDAEIGRLDEASATPASYPYSHHSRFGGSRNPAAPLLPPVA
ncbi:aldo/keto reductase [Sphingomonas solaris]|uniref:Aldo/keto reductase n=1 Tax=Alterirhizorhabdus solaris TaxID=2529389 RepID=A0A558RBL2_9SPHN|nr:aldo/keto reductase [Sphingomonas solaris]TVV76766.1 aldo/keto reductase [Sphingomonas solaris]